LNNGVFNASTNVVYNQPPSPFQGKQTIKLQTTKCHS
jgi:hypothetical protein